MKQYVINGVPHSIFQHSRGCFACTPLAFPAPRCSRPTSIDASSLYWLLRNVGKMTPTRPGNCALTTVVRYVLVLWRRSVNHGRTATVFRSLFYYWRGDCDSRTMFGGMGIVPRIREEAWNYAGAWWKRSCTASGKQILQPGPWHPNRYMYRLVYWPALHGGK